MRTTVRLPEELMRQVKAEAARRGETVTAHIERGLRLVLSASGRSTRRRRVALPVSRARGGLQPGIDLDDSGAVLDALEGRR